MNSLGVYWNTTPANAWFEQKKTVHCSHETAINFRFEVGCSNECEPTRALEWFVVFGGSMATWTEVKA